MIYLTLGSEGWVFFEIFLKDISIQGSLKCFYVAVLCNKKCKNTLLFLASFGMTGFSVMNIFICARKRIVYLIVKKIFQRQ
jgi:hypothetical protein